MGTTTSQPPQNPDGDQHLVSAEESVENDIETNQMVHSLVSMFGAEEPQLELEEDENVVLEEDLDGVDSIESVRASGIGFGLMLIFSLFECWFCGML